MAAEVWRCAQGWVNVMAIPDPALSYYYDTSCRMSDTASFIGKEVLHGRGVSPTPPRPPLPSPPLPSTSLFHHPSIQLYQRPHSTNRPTLGPHDRTCKSHRTPQASQPRARATNHRKGHPTPRKRQTKARPKAPRRASRPCAEHAELGKKSRRPRAGRRRLPILRHSFRAS